MKPQRAQVFVVYNVFWAKERGRVWGYKGKAGHSQESREDV